MSDAEYEAFYKSQRFPTAEQVRAIIDRNPEAAAPRGMWGDLDFLRNVYELNPHLETTQFADYHGHGWNFRGIFKRDREGNLLDAEGEILRPGNAETDTPEQFAYHEERWRQRWRKDDEDLFVDVSLLVVPLRARVELCGREVARHVAHHRELLIQFEVHS